MLLRIFLDDTNFLRTSDLMMFFIFYLLKRFCHGSSESVYIITLIILT